MQVIICNVEALVSYQEPLSCFLQQRLDVAYWWITKVLDPHFDHCSHYKYNMSISTKYIGRRQKHCPTQMGNISILNQTFVQ